MKVIAIIELWDDKTYSIYVPNMQKHNLNGHGKTVIEAKQALHYAVKEYQDMYFSDGKEIPKELCNLEFKYKYDIASFFECYDWINVSKFAERVGINSSVMRQYKKRLQYASEHQYLKIQEAITKLSAELVI